MKRTFLFLVAGLALFTAVPVSATLIISGGFAGQIGDFGLPGKHSGEDKDNDVIMALLGDGVELSGFFAASLLTTTKTRLEVAYLGKEAGYLNTFSIGEHSNLFVTGNKPALGFTQTAVGTTYLLGDFAAGVIDFSFKTYQFGTVPKGSVSNGANNKPVAKSVLDFWLGEKDGWIWVALDDGRGLAKDADYDDLMLKIRAVPVREPESLMLLALGLAGVAMARFRKV